MVRPKKHLGQHFLTDKKIAGNITGLLSADNCDTILEIGPGTGILTRSLLQKDRERLKLIEIDTESVDYLEREFPLTSDMIIKQDFLKTNLDIFGDRIAVIGNFPYNISSQIFFRILDYKDRVEELVGMLQKEVAVRLASGPGSKNYGILSVLLQTWYDITIEFHVSPGSFFPPPKVESTVIRLTRNRRQSIDCNEALYKRVIKQAFNQRRKILGNSLKSIFLNLNAEYPHLKKRPEELSVEQFIDLCRFIENN